MKQLANPKPYEQITNVIILWEAARSAVLNDVTVGNQ